MVAIPVSVTFLNFMTHLHQTKAHADFLSSIGWVVIPHTYNRNAGYYYLRRIPLTPFHHLKIQRMPKKAIDWNKVAGLEKYYRVYETVIEPAETVDTYSSVAEDFGKHGFSPGNDFMLPTATQIIDLSDDIDVLLAAMKHKTRYNIGKAHKNGLVVDIKTTDAVAKDEQLFSCVYDYLRANAKRVKMLLLPKQWIYKQFIAHGNKGLVFFVRTKTSQSLLALMVLYVTNSSAYYALNGSTFKGRSLFAPTAAVWAGIVHAKRRGIHWFNFDGIYDDRYMRAQRRFKGFSHFKSGFGGKKILYCPLFRKWRWPT